MKRVIIFFLFGLLSILLMSCNEYHVVNEYYYFYALSEIEAVDDRYEIVDSQNDLSDKLNELGINQDDYPQIDFVSFDKKSLLLYYTNDYLYTVEGCSNARNSLNISLVRTTNEIESGYQVIFINISNELLYEIDEYDVVIRNSIENTEMELNYSVYDSYHEPEIACDDDLSSNSHIINDSIMYNNYLNNYNEIIPDEITVYDDSFFEDHTLIIYNFFSGKLYSYINFDNAEYLEGNLKVRLLVPRIYNPTYTVYTIWIEVNKNENITSIDYVFISV